VYSFLNNNENTEFWKESIKFSIDGLKLIGVVKQRIFGVKLSNEFVVLKNS
jgi:hypothetical protein